MAKSSTLSIPNHGDGLRLARAAAKKSLDALAFEANVSRHRLFHAEHDRETLTDDEVQKIGAILLPHPTVQKVLGIAGDPSAVRKMSSPNDVRNAIEIVKAFAADPELSDAERGTFASVILRLERKPVESIEKFMGRS